MLAAKWISNCLAAGDGAWEGRSRVVNWQWLSFSLFPKEVLGQMGEGHPFLAQQGWPTLLDIGDLWTCAVELELSAGSSGGTSSPALDVNQCFPKIRIMRMLNSLMRSIFWEGEWGGLCLVWRDSHLPEGLEVWFLRWKCSWRQWLSLPIVKPQEGSEVTTELRKARKLEVVPYGCWPWGTVY